MILGKEPFLFLAGACPRGQQWPRVYHLLTSVLGRGDLRGPFWPSKSAPQSTSLTCCAFPSPYLMSLLIRNLKLHRILYLLKISSVAHLSPVPRAVHLANATGFLTLYQSLSVRGNEKIGQLLVSHSSIPMAPRGLALSSSELVDSRACASLRAPCLTPALTPTDVGPGALSRKSTTHTTHARARYSPAPTYLTASSTNFSTAAYLTKHQLVARPENRVT